MKDEQFPSVDILSCLDGFNLVLSSGGDVIYASNNVNKYIGISTVSFTFIVLSGIFHYVMYWAKKEQTLFQDPHPQSSHVSWKRGGLGDKTGFRF